MIAHCRTRASRSRSGLRLPMKVILPSDRSIDTEGSYAFGTLEIVRSAGGTGLRPGLYRFEVCTVKDIPELSGANADFTIHLGRPYLESRIAARCSTG